MKRRVPPPFCLNTNHLAKDNFMKKYVKNLWIESDLLYL